ncbi:hypothetical protein F5B18DRAFT_622465 [Nemania serpens]|nr:hypothetical protein F5B18DRAFT_622465 [Nemania serpens]
MQVIAALSLLLSLAEAGLVIKAPRTENPGAPPSSGLVMFPLPPTTASPLSTTTTTTTTSTTTATAYVGTESEDPIRGTATTIASAGNSEITAAPTLDLENLDTPGEGEKFVQTTFWACETFPLETHCGWHEPILDASNSGAGRTGEQSFGARAGVAVALAAVALVYGF